MRSITTATPEAGLNRNILNVLNVVRDRANLVELGFRERRELVSLACKRVIDDHLRIFKLTHPGCDFAPVLKRLDRERLRARRWEITYLQTRHKIAQTRTHRLLGNRRQV